MASRTTEFRRGTTLERLFISLCFALGGLWVATQAVLPPPAAAWVAGVAVLWVLALVWHGRRARRGISADAQAAASLALLGRYYPVAVWLVDGEGIVQTFFGDPAGKAGVSRQRFLHQSIEAVLAGNPELAELVRRARAGHRCAGEAEVDGVPYRHRLFPRSQDGDHFGFICISENLAAAREELTAARLWQALFAQAGDAVLVLDRQRTVIAANPAVGKITGYDPAEAIGRRDSLLLSRPPGANHFQAIVERLQRDDVWQGETLIRHKSGQLCEVRMTACAARDEGGRIANYVVMFTDLSQTKKTQEELRHLATHDNLTDLPNRRLFLDRLDQGLRRARRERRELVVLFVDLDDFKAINDTHGHHVGDEILCEAARRLRAAVRQSDTVARLAGDEFTVLAEGPREEADALAAKVAACFARPFAVADHRLQVTASVGVAVYPDDGADIEHLMQRADRSMYDAKARRKRPLPDAEAAPAYDEGLYFPSELRLAIRRGQLRLVYQPQIDLRSGQPVGVEALLRWEHHCRGSINPAEFMDLAEAAGITDSIGHWTLGQVARQLKAWRRWNLPTQRISINVAVSQIKDPRYPQVVADALAQQGVPAAAIALEVGEQAFLRNPGLCRIFFDRARQLGIGLCIDQFGAHTDRFDYIADLPVDAVKINPGQLAGPAEGRPELRFLRALVGLCRVAGKAVIAVGIERSAQEADLIAAGCELGQGFLYSRPLSAEELRTFRPAPPRPAELAS
ncbi:MAG: putative bifunctional diguanylate cyclase/phosphodiesterase [Pseudomonadota bacterium]